MKENVTVIVLAAGLGTRMRSNKAKVLHEAGGDTLLNNVLRAASRIAPPERIIAVVGHQAVQVRESVKLSSVRFAEQLEQKGTGHAVLCARQAVTTEEGRLIILNGDGPLVRPETLEALLIRSFQAPGGSIVTTELQDPTGYGRIVRDDQGMVSSIIEQKSATPAQMEIREVNPGLYCFDAAHFWAHVGEIRPENAAKEYYLTDIVEILTRHGFPVIPSVVRDETELLGINTRAELSLADRILRLRKAKDLMLSGVTMEFPETILIDADVTVGTDSYIEPNVQLRGTTRVGANCRIGSGSILRDCEIADNATILPYVVADNSKIQSGAHVGPFSRLRMRAEAGPESHIGNFVELKNANLGRGSKAGHLAYLGDALIGSKVNVGAGTITCNYDGEKKHRTLISDGAFIGSNSTLVAPLEVAEGAYVGAGSTITKNVESDALALGRAHQVEKSGWAKRRRNLQSLK